MTITAALADGRKLEFPDGTDTSVVQATVKKVLSGGFDKGAIPENDGGYPPEKKDSPGILQRAASKVFGDVEAAGSMISSGTTGILGRVGGAIGGIAGSVATGKYGTQEGAAEAGRASEEGAQKFTYEPRTQAGKDALESISRFFDETKLAGAGPLGAEAQALSESAQAARQAVRPAVGHAARVINQEARDLKARVMPERPAMAGMGSANTEQAAQRRARAESLPVPIKLTKGQAERTFEQQQFERETAKNPKVGEPLRERYADQNEKILQNFDAWVDQTGAEAGSLRATGRVVNDVVVNKSNRAKTEIRTAYREAKDAGHMSEKIDSSPLQSYLDEHQPEAINAGVLTATEAKLKRIARPDGSIDINGLEEIRKMAGRLGTKDATNAEFAKEVKSIIDTMTEGKGGDLYKKARALRFKYGQEFERQGVVARLLAKKPGTNDRAIAYEDVFDHSVLNGSLDDVRAIRKTLQTAGKDGEQAWREIQGATVSHLKEEITKNVQIDQRGNRVVSPAKLNALVTELDKDGKLDFIFGKQGAQQIRDVNGIAQDVFTAPPGSVNTSNTASILIGLLDTAVSGVSGMPLPIGTAANFAVKHVKERALKKRVGEALE